MCVNIIFHGNVKIWFFVWWKQYERAQSVKYSLYYFWNEPGSYKKAHSLIFFSHSEIWKIPVVYLPVFHYIHFILMSLFVLSTVDYWTCQRQFSAKWRIIRWISNGDVFAICSLVLWCHRENSQQCWGVLKLVDSSNQPFADECRKGNRILFLYACGYCLTWMNIGLNKIEYGIE